MRSDSFNYRNYGVELPREVIIWDGPVGTTMDGLTVAVHGTPELDVSVWRGGGAQAAGLCRAACDLEALITKLLAKVRGA